MEPLCGTDVAFRVICGGNLPDHPAIARFRADSADAVAVLSGRVLASASEAANRTEEPLAKMAAERVAARAETDAAEDALSGDAGGEVPAGAADPFTGDERIDAALASVIAAELTGDPAGMAWSEPMTTQAQDAAALIRAHQPPAPAPDGGDPPGGPAGRTGLAPAGAGYLPRPNLTCPGPGRLIATGAPGAPGPRVT